MKQISRQKVPPRENPKGRDPGEIGVVKLLLSRNHPEGEIKAMVMMMVQSQLIIRRREGSQALGKLEENQEIRK
jgi:hypothetical protein